MTVTDLPDEGPFRAEVARTLRLLIDQIDDLDSDEHDARLTDGNLSVAFEDGGVFVLSQQTPTRELWLSANLRAWHFLMSGDGWVERDTGETLAGILSWLFSEKLGLGVRFVL